MTDSIKLFHHLHIDNHAISTLFLMHGTGADERDLLPLVHGLESHYNFVGLLGNVREHGMARFFARDARGVFDQKSIVSESKKLASFVEDWNKTHDLKPSDTAFLGYSNGANMILALGLAYPQLVTKAVCLHPKLPFKPMNLHLAHQQYLITYGELDQMIYAYETREAIAQLQSLGAKVEVFQHEGGHEIWPEEVTALRKFLE